MSVTSYPKPEHAGLDNRRLIILWLGLLAIPLVAVILFAVLQPVKVVPRIGLAPGFIFTDARGERLTNEELRGKLVIYNFTTTSCEAPCVDSSATMQEVQAMVQQEISDIPVALVTVLLDAEQATPARLSEYTAQFDADPEIWQVVTGSAERLKQVVGGGFGLYYEEQQDGTFEFSPLLALVDGNGILRAQYKRNVPDTALIERDLNLIKEEIRSSSGAGGLVYEAAHLFSCYVTY